VNQDPTSGGARPDSDGTSTVDLSGRCVGSSYILVRPIGQGATGTVWRGVDRASGEPVAVKLLHESLLRQPKLVTRFVQERTILLMLRHRNVVRVRDLFSVGESLGLVMDLVTGGSLRDYLREHHTLRPAEAARLAAQVAAALAEAHELGIIHRDLKPDNVLLHIEDGQLDTRLTDFGIARVLNTPRLTTTDAVVGTPHYMSPEAFHGAAASPAADVYALGVLLYELICGRPPYDSDSVPDLMRLHLQGDPHRLPGIPDALWDIITGCLEQKPRLRPTAAELVADLSGVARSAVDAPALPKPAKAPEQQKPEKSRSPHPEVPKPAHPSLPGAKKPPAPRRRNQPASWRWSRPWAMIALISGAMLASGVATTAWHFGRAEGDLRDQSVAATSLRAARPSGSAVPSAAARSAAPRRTGAASVERRVPAGAGAAVRPQATTTVRPEPTRKSSTRSPVQEVKEYGPYDCRRNFALASANRPVMLTSCHSIGAKVQFRGSVAAPPGGTGAAAIAVQDVGTGRNVADPKVCDDLVFADRATTHECGPVTVDPPKGHRYRVVMSWTYTSGGRPATGTARGNEFDW
jgi:serine/threonine-protein kinase